MCLECCKCSTRTRDPVILREMIESAPTVWKMVGEGRQERREDRQREFGLYDRGSTAHRHRGGQTSCPAPFHPLDVFQSMKEGEWRRASVVVRQELAAYFSLARRLSIGDRVSGVDRSPFGAGHVKDRSASICTFRRRLPTRSRVTLLTPSTIGSHMEGHFIFG